MGFISNFFEDVADKLGISTDDFPIPIHTEQEILIEQDPTTLPFPPICEATSIHDDITSYIIKESSESKTGEDYEIYIKTEDAEKPYMHVRGSLLSRFPGYDEIKCYTYPEAEEEMAQVSKLKRKKNSLVLYRDTKKMFDSSKLCMIVNEPHGEDTFVFYKDGGEGLSELVYTINANILGRDVHMKNVKGEIVAEIHNVESSEGNVESYEVRVAKGMDAVFVLCSVCAVDEEIDEQKEKKQKSGEE